MEFVSWGWWHSQLKEKKFKKTKNKPPTSHDLGLIEEGWTFIPRCRQVSQQNRWYILGIPRNIGIYRYWSMAKMIKCFAPLSLDDWSLTAINRWPAGPCAGSMLGGVSTLEIYLAFGIPSCNQAGNGKSSLAPQLSWWYKYSRPENSSWLRVLEWWIPKQHVFMMENDENCSDRPIWMDLVITTGILPRAISGPHIHQCPPVDTKEPPLPQGRVSHWSTLGL